MWYGSFQKWRQKKYGNLYISKLNLIKKWIVGEKRYYTKEVWYGLRITNRVGTQPTPICSDSSLCYCFSGTRMSHFSFIEGGTSQIRVWGSASVEGQKIPSRFYGLLQRRVGEKSESDLSVSAIFTDAKMEYCAESLPCSEQLYSKGLGFTYGRSSTKEHVDFR